MQIQEVVETDLDLNECELIISNDEMFKEDRMAFVKVYFTWEWDSTESYRVVTELKTIEQDDINFYENPGNRFAVLNAAKRLVTEDYIQEIIN
jgi:hypothetical protein